MSDSLLYLIAGGVILIIIIIVLPRLLNSETIIKKPPEFDAQPQPLRHKAATTQPATKKTIQHATKPISKQVAKTVSKNLPKTGTPDDSGTYEGEIKGEKFTVGNLHEGPITTISIKLNGKVPPEKAICINMRDGKLTINGNQNFGSLMKDKREYFKVLSEIKNLLYLGANYIDVGNTATSIFAEFPVPPAQLDKALAAEAAQHIITIKQKMGW